MTPPARPSRLHHEDPAAAVLCARHQAAQYRTSTFNGTTGHQGGMRVRGQAVGRGPDARQSSSSNLDPRANRRGICRVYGCQTVPVVVVACCT